MSSVMPFTFNAANLYVLTINGKPWTRAREVCRALKYEKTARRVVTHHCSSGNIQHKHRLVVVPTAGTTVNWPKDSQKLDLYINEEWMYQLLFSSQQPKAKDFRKHCCYVLFLHFRQQLTNKLEEEHEQAIALLNDDLQEQDNRIQAIQHENVALQAQRDVYQTQLQRFQDQIHDLIINCQVPRANDPGKDNIVMIIEKNTTPEEDEFYEYPYYIERNQRRFINTKRRWFRAQYPHHRFIAEKLGNANNIHAFN